MKDVIVIKIGGVAAQKLSDKFIKQMQEWIAACLLYTSPSPRDSTSSRMPSSA